MTQGSCIPTCYGSRLDLSDIASAFWCVYEFFNQCATLGAGMRLVHIIIFVTHFLLGIAVHAQEGARSMGMVVHHNYRVDVGEEQLSECPYTNDPGLKTIKSPDGRDVYAYKEILPAHFKEWKDSLVADEIITDNVISIPDVVCHSRGIHRIEFVTPIVEYLGWTGLNIEYRPRIGTSGWIARGLEAPAFENEELLNQLKILGAARANHKYEDPYQDGVSHSNVKNTYLKVSPQQGFSIFKRMAHEPNGNRNFWREVFESEVPVYLTEGTKKAASLLTNGYPAISVSGVCAGMRIVDRAGVVSEPRLREDLIALLRRKRTVFIVFDTDTSEPIRKFVCHALGLFAYLLEKEGARVKVIDLPGPEKGVDDFLVARGLEAFNMLSDKALDVREWRKLHGIEKGDLALLTQYYACRI